MAPPSHNPIIGTLLHNGTDVLHYDLQRQKGPLNDQRPLVR